jgi:hypothetical protein
MSAAGAPADVAGKNHVAKLPRAISQMDNRRAEHAVEADVRWNCREQFQPD